LGAAKKLHLSLSMAEISPNIKNKHASSGKKGLRLTWILMLSAILAVTGFQGYWLKNNYDREKQNLEIITNASFRQTVIRLQASKLEFERFTLELDSSINPTIIMEERRRRFQELNRTFSKKNEPVVTIVSLMQEKFRDSLKIDDSGRRSSISSGRKEWEEFLDSPGKPGGRSMRAIRMRGPVDGRVRRIRDVNGVLQKDGSEDAVVIGYGNETGGSIRIDSSSTPGKGELVIETHGPPHGQDEDVLFTNRMPMPVRGNGMFGVLYKLDSLAARDSVTVQEVKGAYAERLKEDNIDIDFEVVRLDSTEIDGPNAVTIGFASPTTLSISLEHTLGYMLNKLKLPILFSILLVGITLVSFALLYRNLIRQQRLTELKNEFISNVTHELKTPIATVGVAIEALKTFNAIDDAARTREYLDISQNELQRLNLLVDKVLKLSIFEKKEIELRKETFDSRQLTEEVMNSLRLQFEKYDAKISLKTEGDDFSMKGDKLHITSVFYNLLDNALKYSAEDPTIEVSLKSGLSEIEWSIRDNGIGIPEAYASKVFEKFFRVPTGNTHNVKGYGLGLSYVAEIVKRHHGTITVNTKPGEGSVFTLRLPRMEIKDISNRSLKV
jgi:two-component system, OmpR family, phosphate regulon sensor histidine kinase PhoR